MSGRAQLIELVPALRQARVLCVGDVMLDHYRYGAVERISPEAPVPVLSLEREEMALGGAGNVARNVKALGADAALIAVIGNDAAGGRVSALLTETGIPGDGLIADEGRRTSVKTRYLAGTQQVLRADEETVAPLAAAVRARLVAAATEALDAADILVLSDYGKGVLDAGVAAELVALARAAGRTVVVDPKGADYARYRGAHVLTPNRRELAEATRMAVADDAGIAAAARHLIAACAVDAVLVTRSRDGMTLVEGGNEAVHLKAEAREVFDVSGAGDTVVAMLACALAAGAGLGAAAALANVAAGIVVAKVGTAVAYADDVAAALHHQDITRAEAKVLAPGQALDRVRVWRQQSLRVGFTNGCFDLLHPGHVALLAKARAACDRLVVGLNSDASVTRLKGDGRPIQGEAARAAVLASLASVDAVVIFADDTPIKLIEAITPDVLVKGADYALAEVVGADVVGRAGGRVLLVDLEPGHSTTATIARMAK